MVENLKSSFKEDLKGEHLVGQFLDMVFYQNAFENHRRAENMREQHQGIDVVVQNKDGSFSNIDEKVQLTKLGNPTPTFAFEVAYLNEQKELRNGWLFKDNKTDYFLLGYFNKMNGNPKKLRKMEEIKEFEFVIISKQVLLNFLYGKGYTREFLEREALMLKDIVENNKPLPKGYSEGETGYRKRLEDGISVFYTTYLAEKPLNVVVNRKYLDQLAAHVVRVTTGNGGKVEILK